MPLSYHFPHKAIVKPFLDVAIKILQDYPTKLASTSRDVLGILAGKPDAFIESKSNMTRRAINWVFGFVCFKPVAFEKESEALKLLRIIWEDIVKRPEDEMDKVLKGPADKNRQDEMPSSGNVNHALELQKLVSEHIVNIHVETQKIMKQDGMQAYGNEDLALQLKTVIDNNISNMQVQTRNIMRGPDAKMTYSSRILFIAAEMGNTKFVVELIRKDPDLIWQVNDDQLTMFHVAVKHRQQSIYNLLYEIGAMKDMITPRTDVNENNMLHLVGKITNKARLDQMSGAVLQMQTELLWFEEVHSMIPRQYRQSKNKDGLTPHELFTKEHVDLVTQGEKWMKGTANQCMVVAALIATIMFAAAFTVPGGYDQNSGIPMFISKATFMVFVVADAISFFFSAASILIFLSILTSRYAERDFLELLPKKLLYGLATLFLSILTMTVTFSVSFFVLYHRGLLWTPILLGAFAVIPTGLYIYLQFSLFYDVIRSTYATKHLFKPTKRVLYYENPKV